VATANVIEKWLGKVLAETKKDPFRLFFPFGWLLGLIGIVPWIPFAWTDDATYPGGFHAVLMSRGFMPSFILGFLMTAVPRFTGTSTARGWEVGVGLASILACFVAALLGELSYARALTLFQIALLAIFIAVRFPERNVNPPGAFLFVAVGLILGFAGSLLELLGSLEQVEIPASFVLFGKLTSFYGMVLALILGVGSRLFPGILGWTEIVHAQREQYEKPPSFVQAVPSDLFLGGILLVLSFLVESLLEERSGRALRAVLVLYVAVRYWRVHRKPKRISWMNWALLAAAWSIVLGEWLSVLFPEWGLDGKHLVFVGGFSLLSLLVAARVTLAHGEGLTLESKRWPYVPVVLFILLASVSRFGAHWTPNSYFPHLAYAAILWGLGAMAWGAYFLPRLWRGLFRKN